MPNILASIKRALAPARPHPSLQDAKLDETLQIVADQSVRIDRQIERRGLTGNLLEDQMFAPRPRHTRSRVIGLLHG